MRRLSGTDAMFLSMETPAWHQHIGGLSIIEPSEKLTYENMVRMIEARLDWAPKFRWKIQEVPFGLDRPMWVDDEEFDIWRHVRRIAVPSPGGREELGEVAGMIMSTKLDRSHPLWELWYIEGVQGDKVAMMMKYHHCLLDGVSSASLATVLLDLEPDATEPFMPPPPEEEQKAGPGMPDGEMLGRVVAEGAQRPFRAARYLAGGASKLTTAARHAFGDELKHFAISTPKVLFNKPVGPRRNLSFSSVSLDDIKKLKEKHGVKVNDVVLALVSGALRNYLDERGELPDEALGAACPISKRVEGDTSMDNQVSNMFVSLCTDVDDPVQRLLDIHEAANEAKAMHQAMSVREMQSLGEVASPWFLSLATRGVNRAGLMSRAPVPANLVVSNVPGPPMDLYCCGGKVTAVFSCSVLLDTAGLNITLLSFKDRIDFGIHVDPELVKDPWNLADQFPVAMAELLKASKLGKPTPVVDPLGA